MVDSLVMELEKRKDYLEEKKLNSIYFGGGTPSLLDEADLNKLFSGIFKYFELAEGAEITLEANPDDLNLEKIKMLENSPVNRLSIGLQSFSDEDLVFMNRAHNANEANQCIEHVLNHGFDNITVDLIYGSPTTSDAQWQRNLDKISDYNISHLSAYCLTVEEKTALGHFVKTGKVANVDDEQASRQFEMLIDFCEANGYENYEISNCARPGFRAIHNTSYWHGKPYLGLGPSAHSYNGKSRQWNVSNNARYLNAIKKQEAFFEIETLNTIDRYNEYVLTRIRTIWGCNLLDIERLNREFARYFESNVRPFIENQWVEKKDAVYTLTRKGKFVSDYIASSLFWEG